MGATQSRCWELSQGPLQELQELLTNEVLYSPTPFLDFFLFFLEIDYHACLIPEFPHLTCSQSRAQSEEVHVGFSMCHLSRYFYEEERSNFVFLFLGSARSWEKMWTPECVKILRLSNLDLGKHNHPIYFPLALIIHQRELAIYFRRNSFKIMQLLYFVCYV